MKTMSQVSSIEDCPENMEEARLLIRQLFDDKQQLAEKIEVAQCYLTDMAAFFVRNEMSPPEQLVAVLKIINADEPKSTPTSG